MGLTQLLANRLESVGPVRVGLIGAGKFGSMFLAQIPTTPGLEVVVIADLDPQRARQACATVGWDEARLGLGHMKVDTFGKKFLPTLLAMK